MAGARAGRHALRPGADQPRPSPAGAHLPHHRLAGPRHHPLVGPGLRRLRSLARLGAGAGGNRPPQARPQDRHGGGLAALRRHRPAQAQRPPAGGAARPAQAPQGAASRRRQRADGGGVGRPVRPHGDRRRGRGEGLRRPAGGGRLLHPHPARRPGRHRRPERRRQDHAAEPAHRRAAPRLRHRPARHQPGAGHARPAARDARSGSDPAADADRRRAATR